MELQQRSDEPEWLSIAEAQEHCSEHILSEQFYAQCGNDYKGEFKAMADAWGRADAAKILSKVEYGHTAIVDVHLRSCAWLDACLHAPYWWSSHRCRPFYIASVTSYAIRTLDCSRNQVVQSVKYNRIAYKYDSITYNA